MLVWPDVADEKKKTAIDCGREKEEFLDYTAPGLRGFCLSRSPFQTEMWQMLNNAGLRQTLLLPSAFGSPQLSNKSTATAPLDQLWADPASSCPHARASAVIPALSFKKLDVSDIKTNYGKQRKRLRHEGLEGL